MESPLRGNTHGGFGERPGETDPEQSGHRAPGRLHCDAPDERCDAHHVKPWWDGGTTALGNLVLACPYHHSLIEPARFYTGVPPDQWQIRFNTHGQPELIPPTRLDPTQTPLPAKAKAR